MALSTYTDLTAAVAGWLHSSSATTADLIRMAEEAISADLVGCALMMRTTSPITLAPAATSLDLPDDAFRVLSAKVVGQYEPMAICDGATLLAKEAASGTPRACAVIGGNDAGMLALGVWPAPSASCDVVVTYSAAVPALDDTVQTTNFVLTRAPSLYLYASLLAGAQFLVDDERVPRWAAAYEAALGRFKAAGWQGDVSLHTDVPMTRAGFDINSGV